jgi:hypothetical protein
VSVRIDGSEIAHGFSPFQKIDLLDHFSRPRQHLRRNRQTDLFRLQVDPNSNWLPAAPAGQPV